MLSRDEAPMSLFWRA